MLIPTSVTKDCSVSSTPLKDATLKADTNCEKRDRKPGTDIPPPTIIDQSVMIQPNAWFHYSVAMNGIVEWNEHNAHFNCQDEEIKKSQKFCVNVEDHGTVANAIGGHIKPEVEACVAEFTERGKKPIKGFVDVVDVLAEDYPSLISHAQVVAKEKGYITTIMLLQSTSKSCKALSTMVASKTLPTQYKERLIMAVKKRKELNPTETYNAPDKTQDRMLTLVSQRETMIALYYNIAKFILKYDINPGPDVAQQAPGPDKDSSGKWMWDQRRDGKPPEVFIIEQTLTWEEKNKHHTAEQYSVFRCGTLDAIAHSALGTPQIHINYFSKQDDGSWTPVPTAPLKLRFPALKATPLEWKDPVGKSVHMRFPTAADNHSNIPGTVPGNPKSDSPPSIGTGSSTPVQEKLL
jgi:hypothetical protein